MKNLITLSIIFLSALPLIGNAQDRPAAEKYGKTLNIGVGVGYYGYVGHPLPVGSVNFEFDVARNFTLAPFAGCYTYQNYYYWGNPGTPHDDNSYRLYSYRETVAPIGVKGTYYFDQLFHANPKWDFYAAGSVGFVLRSVVWESAYNGDRRAYQSSSPLFLDAHIGAEYHINQKAGVFADLSTGVSTVGLAIHF